MTSRKRFPRTSEWIRDRRAYLKDVGEPLTFDQVKGFCERLEKELIDEQMRNDSMASDLQKAWSQQRELESQLARLTKPKAPR